LYLSVPYEKGRVFNAHSLEAIEKDELRIYQGHVEIGPSELG
jgi:hypothetical protein